MCRLDKLHGDKTWRETPKDETCSDDEESNSNEECRINNFGDVSEKLRHRNHFLSSLGLVGMTFSMYYLTMNVFPYSGFMALHLLNKEEESSSNATTTDSMDNTIYYTAATIGPYAGVLAASFRLGRIPTAFLWGTIADKYGRKFVAIVSGIGILVGHLAFGIAPSFQSAVTIRFMTGILNGTVVAVRTSITEIARGDKKLESRGVAMMSSSMSGYGALIGPAVGGLLSEPIKQFPRFFDCSEEHELCSPLVAFWKPILHAYPFLLPNLVGAIIALVSLVMVLCFVDETLPDDKRRDWKLIPNDIATWITVMMNRCFERRSSSTDDKELKHDGFDSVIVGVDIPNNEKTPLVSFPPTESSSNNTNSHEKPSVWSILSEVSQARYFLATMWAFAFTSLVSLETFPLFAMASIDHGGLGLDETSIGLVQTIAALVFITSQPFAFRRITEHFGFLGALKVSALARSICVLAVPVSVFLSKDRRGQLAYLGLVLGLLGIGGSIFSGCTTMGLNGCVTDASVRASMNGVHSMGGSLGRGLGPIAAGFLVASTISSGAIPAIVSGWVVYSAVMALEGMTYWTATLLPKESFDTN